MTIILNYLIETNREDYLNVYHPTEIIQNDA